MTSKDAIWEESTWLLTHPDFEERPATIRQFLGPEYLNIESKVREGIAEALEEIFGTSINPNRFTRYERAMLTGAIGIGKTTFASIALPYMAHWVLCLKSPQEFFGLLPGSRIAFMQMSTSEQQAREVVFGDINARIDHSDWFKKYPRDEQIKRQIRFKKDIWIIPGDSSETSFEGYNILGGILDEMDSHKATKDKDYADVGYETIHSRIASRFVDEKRNGHRGLLICIGQMKKQHGFAANKKAEFDEDPEAYVKSMTIWESFGWHRYMKDGKRDSFWYDPNRKTIISSLQIEYGIGREGLIEIPNAYMRDFKNNPAKALRDLAGIPPAVEDQFIALVDRIEECFERWVDNHKDSPSPVDENNRSPKLAEWFRANGDPRKRVAHIDIATSGDGDALGFAMGHVKGMTEDDTGERKPYVVIDMLYRIKAPGGSQIMLSDIRQLIYRLKEDLGFRLVQITMDGFNSTDTMQQLRKKRFRADYLSVDRDTLPYEDLRDAIYERRIEFPPYMTYLRNGDTETINILLKELRELQDTGKKIDHPPKGSKDVADCVAGVVNTLMGDRTYHKGLVSAPRNDAQPASPSAPQPQRQGEFFGLPGTVPGMMPVKPGGFGAFDITLPKRLR